MNSMNDINKYSTKNLLNSNIKDQTPPENKFGYLSDELQRSS